MQKFHYECPQLPNIQKRKISVFVVVFFRRGSVKAKKASPLTPITIYY